MLEIGDKLPEFKSVNQDGKRISSKDLLGKPTIVYFYPIDDTPGCTREACSFRDNFHKFNGVNLVGVSTQGQESHKKFSDKYRLNFTLVVDKKKQISKTFGVLKVTGTASRSTFIFDKKGELKFVYPAVTPDGHSREVLEKLKELGLI
ncbi:MAG TPA: peroxiredoxin [archaeon]|nr:peroxiredoxin [archaeon]